VARGGSPPTLRRWDQWLDATGGQRPADAPHRPRVGGSHDWMLWRSARPPAFSRWSHRHGAGGDHCRWPFFLSFQSCSHRRGVGGERHRGTPSWSRPITTQRAQRIANW